MNTKKKKRRKMRLKPKEKLLIAIVSGFVVLTIIFIIGAIQHSQLYLPV